MVDGREWRSTPPGRHRWNWWEITAELQQRPGEWMLLERGAPRSLAGAISRKRMTALRTPGWEYLVKTENNTDKTADVWLSAVRTEEEVT